ncbi:MAG TPA: vWA domain-containing protein [Lacipirellulaceae bacterium]|nr:vWA domain-containing protein [Lacipirellulaceae bacterium]
MATVENPRLWSKVAGYLKRVTSLRELSAWSLSFVVHATILVLLASLTLYFPIRQRILLSLEPVVEVKESPPPQEFHFSPDPHEQIGALSEGGVGIARPSAPLESSQPRISNDLVPTAPPVSVGKIEVHDINQTILAGPNLPENVIIKGSGSVGATGAVGAVDRITHEILLSLDERPTLVVWLFDQSGSLKPQRESIAKRFDRVYKELGIVAASGNSAFKQHGEDPLLTAVAEFGNSMKLITPKPISDLSAIQSAVRNIEDDPKDNGTENVFQSVGYLAEQFRHFRLSAPRRNVMIVVFTDEAGDDVQSLDKTVDICRKYEMPVYLIGVPAPFGRETAYVKWVDPDPKFDQSPQKAPVHTGPESLLPERLMLLFGGTPKDEEQVDSGFGPFGLSRLAYETGGLYFTVHPNRDKGNGKKIEPWETAEMSTYISTFFDERIMRNYRPDYISAKQYNDLLKTNKACATLVEASRLSATTPMENVRLRFPRLDDAQFARELSTAQRESARLEPKIEALATLLRQGERDRDKITTPRWQAGYDLAIGRTLAVKVRTEGYNAMLANAKQGLKFKNEKSDTWELRPTSSVTVSSALAKDADDAKKYLDRVLADNQGTPWAMDAAKELKQPFGWEWHEEFDDIAGKAERAKAKKNQPKPNKPEPPKKPRRDPPPL